MDCIKHLLLIRNMVFTITNRKTSVQICINDREDE